MVAMYYITSTLAAAVMTVETNSLLQAT